MNEVAGDTEARLTRAQRSLEGLSLGDALGQRFFIPEPMASRMVEQRALPRAPWLYTDDTEMALGLLAVLREHGAVDQDALARSFAERWCSDPARGYAGMAAEILQEISMGTDWREAAQRPFRGAGSMGNGAAMRVAPLGAWFADDVARVVAEARRSAEVTHLHPEGIAGAVAVAVAAHYAWRATHDPGFDRGDGLVAYTLRHTPAGETRDGIARARDLGDVAPERAAEALGSGNYVIAQDTVPFTLWCAARYADDFEAAIWSTLRGLGDRDTTCAIVGGIVALSAPPETVPEVWRASREPLAYQPARPNRALRVGEPVGKTPLRAV